MGITIGLIGAAIVGAFAVGAVVYLAYKLTVSFLKKYRKKETSMVLAATVKDLIKNAPKMKLDDLDDLDEDDVILAEYDEDGDELVQDISVAKDVDDSVRNILYNNEGTVVFE